MYIEIFRIVLYLQPKHPCYEKPIYPIPNGTKTNVTFFFLKLDEFKQVLTYLHFIIYSNNHTSLILLIKK